MKCNGDCLNCIYDDCILDEEECQEDESYYQEMDLYAKRYSPDDPYRKYKNLRARFYYWKNPEPIRSANRIYYYKHREYRRRKHLENYYKNHSRYILQGVEYRKTKKLKNYINWYNKYLEFIGLPQKKNPYIKQKMSQEEILKNLEKEIEWAKKEYNIRSWHRRNQDEKPDETEKALIAKAKQESNNFMQNLISIKKRKY